MKNNGEIMETESSCSARSKKRLERKKRKAAAFLELVKKEPDKTESHQTEVIDDTASPSKKLKLDTSQIKGSKQKTNDTAQDTDGSKNGDKKKTMSEEMYAEYVKMVRTRQKQAMQRPKIFLTLDELTRDYPSEVVSEDVKEVPPLFMSDVQNLLLYGLQGNIASEKPRWCQLLRVMKVTKVITVVLDSLSKEEFDKYTDHLPTLKSAFDVQVDLVAPAQYSSSVKEDLLNVPFSIRQLESKFEHLNKNEINNIKNKMKEVRKRDGVSFVNVENTRDYKYDKRMLMLATDQMIREGIPMPYKTDIGKYKDFVYSKTTPYKNVNGSSPMFAVDCEMVQTADTLMELARVSVVNENLEVVYDTYVKPRAKVTNYVTRYSGILPHMLKDEVTRLEDVQKTLDDLLPADAILCGQSIGGDLRSMKVFHPYLIDTSVIFNLTGNYYQKPGLKKLAALYLNKTIQGDDKLGHSSVEDATATMELVQYKLRTELYNGDEEVPSSMMSFEDPETQTPSTKDASSLLQSTVNALSRQRLFFQQEGSPYMESFISRIAKQNKTGVVIDEADSPGSCPKETLILHCDTDKKRRKQTIQSSEDVDFCLTFLYGYRDLIAKNETVQEEDVQRCLWVLDRHVWKILRKTQERTLFSVILTGRSSPDGDHKAMTFSKIV